MANTDTRLTTLESGAVATTSQTEYTTAQMDLIRKTVANGTTPLEFDLFMEVVRRTGLDPFMKQIYAIKRGDKLTIQTGIDGYRLIADRTERCAGSDDPIYDVDDAAHPNKASVTVWKFVRDMRVPFTATARWTEYCQRNRDGNPTGKWADMPYLMLAKCAEALALRKAFPAELSGVYTREEMEQADNTPAAYVEATPAPAQAHAQAQAQRATAPESKAAPDRVSAALRNADILKLLNRLDCRAEATQRAKLEEAFAALEAVRATLNPANLKAELQRQIDLADAQTTEAATDEYDLVSLGTGHGA